MILYFKARGVSLDISGGPLGPARSSQPGIHEATGMTMAVAALTEAYETMQDDSTTPGK